MILSAPCGQCLSRFGRSVAESEAMGVLVCRHDVCSRVRVSAIGYNFHIPL